MMRTTSPKSFVIILFPIIVGTFAILGILFMRRKGYPSGASKNVIVRCGDGHLFTTIWIPLISLKAIRLGPIRYQHCPIGNHWALVEIVNELELTNEEKRFAYEHHDSHIP